MKEDWSATEKKLLKEAASMGQLLTGLRQHISPRLIDGRGWELLLERASETPATMAAFPFGFEIPLHDPEPRADFGVSLVGDSASAARYQEKGKEPNADASTAALARLLDETEMEDSDLRRIAGRKMLLEFDIDAARPDTRPDPGIFLYPVDDAVAGDGKRFGDLAVVYDAIVSACGWDRDAAERETLERLYRTLEPDTLVRAVGGFPGRSERGVRIAVTGFRKADDLVAFLERAGWSGQCPRIDEIVSFFDQRKAFAYLGAHFDIRSDGLGPALGLSFFAHEREWLKDIRHWTALIDGIRDQGHAVSEKLSELANWSTGSTIVFGAAGAYMLVRGIHHIKLTITGNQVDQVKGYVFFLMMAGWRKTGQPA
ncbi:MAG: hypothetical protein OXF03_06145 [Gammaproteobacteria bacterium]|nr:hypothetical protein [Gammaproteobacteria bacterium]